MNKVMLAAGTSVALATLCACGGGGGGGGGGGPSAIDVPFTSFSGISANQTVVMDGVAVTASGTQVIDSNGDFTITSANVNPAGGGTARLSYDGNRLLKTIDISTPQSSVLFDRDTAGHSLECSGVTCIGANPTSSGIAVDATAPGVGWNYQSFGVWASDTSPSNWVGGAISIGAPTPGTAIPLSGNAGFTGVAAGFYFDAGGVPFATAAAMTANVDFSQRTIGFLTSNTTLINANTGAQSTDPGLNLTGNLSYAPGVNAFSGAVTTSTPLLTGQASGRFYGPSAQEIGGVYSLQGAGATMFGGFGGKQ